MKFWKTKLLMGLLSLGNLAKADPAPLPLVKPAYNLNESKELFAERIERVFHHFLRLNKDPWRASNQQGSNFPLLFIAYAATNQDMSYFNDEILKPSSKREGLFGSSFDYLGPLCQRKGDFDFIAINLIRGLYLALQNATNLSDTAVRKLVFEILPGGTEKEIYFSICGIKVRDTENHILMTEVSRYLNNQLRFRYSGDDRDNNAKNGFNQWMNNHIKSIFLRYFEEYNSKPYQKYALKPIHALYDFAEDEQVRQKAKALLDLVSAFHAIRSHDMREFPPFRRQPGNERHHQFLRGFSDIHRLAVLVGNHQIIDFSQNQGVNIKEFANDLTAATSKYRVPDEILDLWIDKDNLEYWQKFRYDNAEVIATGTNYLITAGGFFDHHLMFGTDEQHGWARPTLLIPYRNRGIDHTAFFRFDGHKDRKKKSNLCVAPGFMCGLNPELPDGLKEQCIVTRSRWTFIDLSGERCEQAEGIYVAYYRPKRVRGTQQRGFMEVRTSDELTFEHFVDRILGFNANEKKLQGGTIGNGEAEYTKSDGTVIGFFYHTNDLEQSPIVSFGTNHFETNSRKWPLVQGDILRELEPGLLEFQHPRSGDRLLLDSR